MKRFFSKIDGFSAVLGIVGLAVVEMVIPKVATAIVSVGNDIKKKVGVK